MSPRSQAHVEAMRERLLDSARRVFASRGYRDATVPEIAKAAGVSVGNVYRYFPSKERLFLDICLDGSAVAYARLAEQMAAIPDPRTRLVVSIEAWLASLQGDVAALVVQARAVADTQPMVAEMLADRDAGLAEMCARVVHAVSGDDLAPETVDRLARGAQFTLEGALVECAAAGASFDPARARDAILAVLEPALGLSPQAAG